MKDLERVDPSLAIARKAFLAMVHEIRPQLHRYCARMTGSVLDGEDIVQDTLATAYYKLSLMSQGVPLRAWLFKIAHNKCIDFLRSTRPHEEWTVEGFDEGVPFSDEIERLEDLQRAVRRLLLLLPPMERACVVFKDVLDYDLAAIADTLETSVGGVKAALHRGRQKLKSVSADPPGKAAEQPDLLKLYVQRFNARDWPGLCALLKADAECEVVGSWAAVGRAPIEADYFGRYASFDFPWRMSLAQVDDETVCVCWKQAEGKWTPRSLARIRWDRGLVGSIRDYIYIPYLLEEAVIEAIAP